MISLLNITKQILKEGKYSNITKQVVNLIVQELKTSIKKKKHTLETFINDNDIQFELVLNIIRTKKQKEYTILAFTDSEDDTDESQIEISIVLSPINEQEQYSNIYMELIDTIRHEIEHLTQSGTNKKDNKPKKTNTKQFQKLVTEPYKEYLLKDEIPAYVRGFYERAKKERRYLDDIMLEFLNYYVDISKTLTIQQRDKIMKVWIKYAKDNLPSAKFKNN